ncbi:MAG: deoxyribodipyrimidine photo-lyase [Pseudomonadota bacterium]
MSARNATLLWFRRDLRLADHEALIAAQARGGPVIPVFVCDPLVDALGAAPRWRLGLALEHLARRLEDKGSRLVLRRGNALEVLRALARETGADAVYWSRAYDPDAIARDTAVKTALTQDGIVAHSHTGHLLFEPWTVQTGAGGFYRVYSPFWKAVRGRDVATPLDEPATLRAPVRWPDGDALPDWRLGRGMNRGAAVCLPYQRAGEAAALERLHSFTDGPIAHYRARRDIPGVEGTSGVSDNLALGEISPRRCWQAGRRALEQGGGDGAETWLKELVWREFAYHLAFHTPHIVSRNWRAAWDDFPWNDNEDDPRVTAWQQGRTGEPFVDAAMREMYVTGKMHNRGRMIVASYLTKHLMCHWRIGQRWFDDCLTDWDPASNAMGWQWAAGSGPDAAPYFRVFNPATQLEKFDPDSRYRDRWIAEGQDNPGRSALSYFEAVPRSWHLDPTAPYPGRIVGLAEGRARALQAYKARSF